jgi:hypothetical protein
MCQGRRTTSRRTAESCRSRSLRADAGFDELNAGPRSVHPVESRNRDLGHLRRKASGFRPLEQVKRRNENA